MTPRRGKSRLTREEKAALISIHQRGFIAWSLGIKRKGSVMVARLAAKGMLKRDGSGVAVCHLTRAGRLAIRALRSRHEEPRWHDRAIWSNPKVGRSHIARKIGVDPWGFDRRLDQFDEDMRP